MRQTKCIPSLIFAVLCMAPALGIASEIERLPPDVDVIGPDGVQRNLSTYLTRTTVLYVFTGTSFPSEMDRSIWRTLHRKGIRALAICLDPAPPIQDERLSVVVLRAADSRLYEAYKAEHLPLRVLMDQSGVVRYRGDDPSALLAEIETSPRTDIDESTWAKIKELFR